MRSKKLSRQIRKSFGDEEFESVLASFIEQRLPVAADGEKEILTNLQEFSSFLGGIDESYTQNEKMLVMAQTNLEVGTKELTQVNGSLLMLNQTLDAMLNSLGQGFLLFGPDGVCSKVYSKKCEQLLECVPAGKPIYEVLRIPERDKESFTDWISYLCAGVMDFNDLRQLGPKTFPHSEKLEIWLEYMPVRNKEGQITHVLMIATDRTKEIAAVKEAEEMRYFAQMVVKMVRGKGDFLQFLRDAERFVQTIAEVSSKQTFGPEQVASMKMAVHTLKGAAAAFSVRPIEMSCHIYESNVSEVTDVEAVKELARKFQTALEEEMQKVGRCAQDILGASVDKNSPAREISIETLRDFSAQLKKSGDARLLDRFEKEILAEPASAILQGFNQAISQAAIKTKKRISNMKLEGGDVPMMREPYENFFSNLVHVFRNMVDHGIEAPDRRLSLGKPEEGQIKVSVEANGGELLLSIEDDGQGIQVDRVKAKLESNGMKTKGLSDDQLIMQIFEPGFSTAEVVTELSGRGVGLSGVKEAVEAIGGRVEVKNRPGKGCTFVFRLPYLGFSAVTGKKKLKAAA